MSNQLELGPKQKRDFCLIVSREGDQLSIDDINLTKLLNNCTNTSRKTAFISILGIPQSINQFYAKLLTSYFIHKDDNENWYAHRPSVPTPLNDNEQLEMDNRKTGIYMCLGDFFVDEMYTMKPVQVCVLYLHYHKDDPRTAMDNLEQFIVLVCSRIVEISKGENELSIFGIRDHLLSAKPVMPQMICDSVVNIRKSEQTPFQPNQLTSGGASIISVLSEINRSEEVGNFQHFNIVHQRNTFNEEDVYEGIAHKKLVYLITDSCEFRPKLKFDGEPILTSDITSFFTQMMDIVNTKAIDTRRLSNANQGGNMDAFMVQNELTLITKVCKKIQAFCIQEMSSYIQQIGMTRSVFEQMSMALIGRCENVIYEVALGMQGLWKSEEQLAKKIASTKQLLQYNFIQLDRSRWG